MEEEKRKSAIATLLAESKQDKNILLLGGASHLASHIVEKFMIAGEGKSDDAGACKLTVVDSKDPAAIFVNPEVRGYQGSPRITLKQTSLHDWEWLENSKQEYDTIINAWMVHDAIYANNNPSDTVYRNVVGAQSLMNALVKGSGWDGNLVIISTDKVYGRTGDDYVKPMKQKSTPIPETAELQPLGVRAVTRASQELIQTGIAKSVGIDFVCLRLGTTYGPFTPAEKSIYSWIRSLLLNQTLKINGEFSKDDSPARDWVNIQDVSKLIAFVSLSRWSNEIKNEVYNVGACEKQPHFIQNISEAFKTVVRRGTMSSKQPWREPGEKMLRIWLDCEKVQEKLLFLPDEEFIYAATRDLSMWIAHNDLRWGTEDMEKLKKNLGIMRKAKDSPLHGGKTGGGEEKEEDQGRFHLSSQLG
jgi:nucleoside-diphosphate-sugar epimerase